MVLGDKLGEGAGAEVFAWTPGRVVKLFKPAIPKWIAEHEVRATRAAFEAGAPAPEVFDFLEIDGRSAMVLPRYDGTSLGSLVQRGEMAPADGARIMAGLHHALHTGVYRSSLHDFRSWATFTLGQLRKRGVITDLLDGVEAVVARLPESGVLCHGDFHALNVIMTADGPRIVDWVSALNANPLLDVARQHLTFTVFTPDGAEFDALRAADEPFIAEYARLSGQAVSALREAMAPYVTVLAATRLMDSGIGPNERPKLIELIRAGTA